MERPLIILFGDGALSYGGAEPSSNKYDFKYLVLQNLQICVILNSSGASYIADAHETTFVCERNIMNQSTTKTIQLISSLLLGDRDPSVIPYAPSKTEIPQKSAPYFRRSSPSKHGISPERITAFLSELEGHNELNVHSVIILKDGEIISEAYAPGFERGVPHLAHSMSKTVTAIAAAILADEEKLDTGATLSEIFTEFSLPRDIALITVGDIVRMSSGLSFSEIGAVTSDTWTEDFLFSSDKFPHGEGFHYNSMNSYILARIIERLSGESFGDFVRTRLFEPLGIKDYLWEKGPEGTEKGGWGLYLSTEDWLKIASLFITGGKHEDRTVVSHISMLDVLLTRNEYSSENNEDFDYAGHINMHKRSSALLLNGLFGQNVYIDPSHRLAVAINSGSAELFKSGRTVGTVLKYFPPELDDERLGLFGTWRATRALRKQERRFFASRAFVKKKERKGLLSRIFRGNARLEAQESAAWNAILGRYTLPKNNMSLLPLIQRIIENNLRGGIDTLEILREGSGLSFRFFTPYALIKISAGLGEYRDNVLEIDGELYRVRAVAGICLQGDITLFRLELVFPELPNARYLTIRKSGDGVIELELKETPDAEVILPFLDSAIAKSNFATIAFGMIEKKLGHGFVERKIRELFSPSLIAPLEGAECEQSVLDEENTRLEKERQEILSVPFISAFLKKDGASDEPKETLPKRRGFLGFLAGLFGAKKKEAEEGEALLAAKDAE